MIWMIQSYSQHPHNFISRAYTTFMAKKTHPLIWTGARAASENKKGGMPDRLNYCVIITVYTIYKCDRRPHNTTWCAAGGYVMTFCEVACEKLSGRLRICWDNINFTATRKGSGSICIWLSSVTVPDTSKFSPTHNRFSPNFSADCQCL